jgi:PAS domain S-box-containing protein
MVDDLFVADLPQASSVGHYNWWLVLTSCITVSTVCFIAMTFVGRARGMEDRTKNRKSQPGAFFFGSAIWLMHITGMLAFKMDEVPTGSAPLLAASYLMALMFSWLAFERIPKLPLGNRAIIISVFLVGMGIVLMHYMGIQMARVDSHAHAASKHLTDAKQIVSEVQTKLINEPPRQAAGLKDLSFVIVGILLFMVASSSLYGHKLSQMSRRNEETRLLQRQMLDLIAVVQSIHLSGEKNGDNGVFEVFISKLLELSCSDYGFICEVSPKEDGSYDLNDRAVSESVRNNKSRRYSESCHPGSLYDRAIKAGEPLIATRSTDQVPVDDGSDGGAPFGSRMAIPIFLGNDVVGIVGLASLSGNYSQKDIDNLDPVFRAIETIAASSHDRTERDLANEKLVESTKSSAQVVDRFHGILDNTEALIYMKDSEGRILLANRKLCMQFKHEEADILGNTDYDFLPRKYADRLARNDKRILSTLKPEQMEEIVAIKGQDPRYYLSMKFPLFDEVLGEYIICGISTDITEIKKAQQSLEESNAWLDGIMHTVPEGILTVESDGTIKSANRAVCDLFGYSESELERSSINMLLPEDKDSNQTDRLREYFHNDRPPQIKMASNREIVGRRKDGSDVPLEIHLNQVSFSGIGNFAIVSVRDITKWKQTEEELKRHRDHLQDMVDEQTRYMAIARETAEHARREAESFAIVSKNNPYPIIKLDQNGEIILFNPAANVLFGDLEEKGLEHPFLSDALSMMNEECVINREITIDHITYLQTIVVTDVRDSRVITFYSNDVTPLKKAQRDAERASELKSEFLANMSHELRTPMHAIISFSRLGMGRIDRWDRDRQVENLERINQSGHRLSGLLNDLLDLTKLEAGNGDYVFESVDLVSLITAAAGEIEVLAANRRQPLILPTAVSCSLRAECDRGKIHQVMVNLMSNAIKFTPEGKQVSVECVEDTNTRAIRITVCDEGVGIPEGEMDAVFDKFIQSSKTKTGAGGTGLGLAISKEIVEGHSGKIWAENNSRGGADFHVLLPLVQESGERA